MRRFMFGLLLALGMTMVPASAQADTVSAEAEFVARINALRTGQGLPAFEVHPVLVAKARGWAQTMSDAGRIWHSTLSDGVTVDWQKLGENVGMGGSVDGLHQAFVASPRHHDNLIDPDFRYVGIGVAMNGDTMYVSEVFMKVMEPKPAPVVTPAPIPPTRSQKPTTPPTTPRPKPTPAPPPAGSQSRVPTPTAAPVSPPGPATLPVAEAAAPPSPTRVPSALLVSVLERLRTFDS